VHRVAARLQRDRARFLRDRKELLGSRAVIDELLRRSGGTGAAQGGAGGGADSGAGGGAPHARSPGADTFAANFASGGGWRGVGGVEVPASYGSDETGPGVVQRGACPRPGGRRRRDESCPVSTEGGTRRVQLVRVGRGGGDALRALHLGARRPRGQRSRPAPAVLPRAGARTRCVQLVRKEGRDVSS